MNKNDIKKDKIAHIWTSHPLIDNPIKSIFVCILIIFLGYILWQLDALLLIIILLIALLPYFVPTTYIFYQDYFCVQYPFFKIQKKYSEYGCFYSDKTGIMLSTFKRPRKLDAFRGQSIRFSKSKNEKEAIIDFLINKVGKQY